MTDVDRIYEAALADEWEEQNSNPHEEKLRNAAAKLRAAVVLLNAAVERMESAEECVKGIPAEDVVASYYADVDNLRSNIRRLYEKYERGQTH